MQIGAYFDHGTWRTPGPQLTPLRVMPGDPALAGGVMAAAPRRVVPPPEPPPAVTAPACPAIVVAVPASPAAAWVAPLPPAATLPTREPWFLPTVGTRVTTSRSAVMPTTNGEYRRATLAR